MNTLLLTHHILEGGAADVPADQNVSAFNAQHTHTVYLSYLSLAQIIP